MNSQYIRTTSICLVQQNSKSIAKLSTLNSKHIIHAVVQSCKGKLNIYTVPAVAGLYEQSINSCPYGIRTPIYQQVQTYTACRGKCTQLQVQALLLEYGEAQKTFDTVPWTITRHGFSDTSCLVLPLCDEPRSERHIYQCPAFIRPPMEQTTCV